MKRADGKFEPFSLYTMRQAIEERFILDVLQNYTTYKSYFAAEEDPGRPPLRTQRRMPCCGRSSISTKPPSARRWRSWSITS